MPSDGTTDRNLVSGEMISRYLEKYADDNDLKRFIRFNVWVSNIERSSLGWRLTVNGATVFSRKLIIASGITSVKNSPSFEVQSGSITVMHTLDIASKNMTKLLNNQAHHFVVVGAAKSAYDVVYHLCTLGKKVTRIIRPDGSGPMPIMSTEIFGKNTITLASTRIPNYLSPSLMNTDSTVGAFFHRTVIGRSLTKSFWNFVTGQAEKAAGFGCDGSRIDGLRPDIRDASCFWCDGSLGLITNSDFWSTLNKSDIANLRDNVAPMDSTGATLRSGKMVRAQYLIYCTGWGDHFSFFSPELKEEFGIPECGETISHESAINSYSNNWETHDQLADAVVDKKLPLLAAGPKDFKKSDPNRAWTQRRWRLYNRCVPISTANVDDRSVVILGQIYTTQTPTIAAIQSLWAVAYLLGEVNTPSDEAMIKEVAEWNAWTRKRYLGVGEKCSYALFDWIPYLDRLLQELNVKCQRKKGIFANIFGPHGPRDYGGVIEEYMVVRKERQGKSKGVSAV